MHIHKNCQNLIATTSIQVQISPQGVVMTAVLHPNHSVRCLPEVNPELAQAIVQTDISGPIEATHHLVQADVPVSIEQTHTQEQLQTHIGITNQVDITSHPTGSLIDSASNHEVESSTQIVNAEEVVSAVQDPSAVMVSITDSLLTTQSSRITDDITTNTLDRPITSTCYQQGK
jgi:hypothetical protein